MKMVYENFQNSGSEEKNQGIGKVSHPQSIPWNIFSRPLFVLFSLGLSFLLLVAVSVIGSQNSQLQQDLVTLRTTFNNLTSSTKNEVQALASKDNSLQEMINSLKEEVEDHRHELQSGRGVSQKVDSLKTEMEKKEQALKTDQSELVQRVQKLGNDLTYLSCQLAKLRNNDSETNCCPPHWMKHEGSCYWFSQSGKPWSEADKYCRLENAHLVVVNSMKEQIFIHDHKGSVHTWMGLTDQNGPWRWVDGTDYNTGFKNWRPEQPDNWEGHGLGGGEDCAHFSGDDGRWNDDACQRPYRWVCEIELSKDS